MEEGVCTLGVREEGVVPVGVRALEEVWREGWELEGDSWTLEEVASN
jgi:hypothetical protein